MSSDPIFGKRVARALAAIPGNATPLEAAEKLRIELGGELARRAAELRELRFRALKRFDRDYFAFITRKGLQQASAQRVAEARARRIALRGAGSVVWDATCGIGADALALADAGLRVVASDRDFHTLRYARANFDRRHSGVSTVQADATASPVRADFAVFDPDRRADGERSLDPERWSPSLAAVLAAAAGFQGACIKLPPAFDPARAPAAGCSLQWVSLGRELCEVNAWLGELARPEAGREVLALDGQGGAAHLVGLPREVPALDPTAARGVRWLAEPDPAVIRAGLVGDLAAREGLAPLAPRIAYLGGDARPTSPLLASWRVLGTSSLDRRRVRALLAQHDVGPLVVKKRGHPDSAEVLARRLRGSGARPGLLAVARMERGHLAILLDSLSGKAPGGR